MVAEDGVLWHSIGIMEYSIERNIQSSAVREHVEVLGLDHLFTIAPGEKHPFTFGDTELCVTATVLSDAPDSLGRFAQHGRFYSVQDVDGNEIVHGQYIVELTDVEISRSGSVHVSEKETPICRVSIRKSVKFKDVEKYRGLGKVLYQALLDDLEHVAKTVQKPLCHVVKHITDAGLSSEQWSSVFDDILQGRGYVKNKNGQWEKTYFSQ